LRCGALHASVETIHHAAGCAGEKANVVYSVGDRAVRAALLDDADEAAQFLAIIHLLQNPPMQIHHHGEISTSPQDFAAGIFWAADLFGRGPSQLHPLGLAPHPLRLPRYGLVAELGTAVQN
jgi:hypothetical protein